MRLVFFGTPEFAVPSLHALHAAGFQIAAVVTRPDALRGRGRDRREPPPVADAAHALGLTVLQPERPSAPGFLESLTALKPDALAVTAYGHLIPDPVLQAATHGAWNVHPSLLPRWRGPAPVHRAISEGDPETGVTIIRLEKKLDAGPMAAVERTPIAPGETRGMLEARLAATGARMLVAALKAVDAGRLTTTPQDESGVTYAAMFKDADRELRWTEPADALERLVRALLPAPGAWFSLRGERVKVLAAAPGGPVTGAAPGTLLAQDPSGGWAVACATGSLILKEVQPEGKGRMTMDALLAGRRLAAGATL